MKKMILMTMSVLLILCLTACGLSAESAVETTRMESATQPSISAESEDVWKIFDMSDNELEEYAKKNEALLLGDLKSYDDLDDNMIRSKECGISVLKDVHETTPNGYKRSFFSFNGVDDYIEISVGEETEVSISCVFDGNQDSFRSVLLLPNEEIIELPLDNTVNEVILPEGITKVVLAGFKAKGVFGIFIEQNDNIAAKQIK